MIEKVVGDAAEDRIFELILARSAWNVDETEVPELSSEVELNVNLIA